MMDTYVVITIFNPPPGIEESAIHKAFAYMRTLEELLSKTMPNSDVYRINTAAAGCAVPVSDATIEILRFAKDIYILTDGLFDVTVGAVSALWDFIPGAMPPPHDSISYALQFVGMGFLELDYTNNTVTKQYCGVRIDLGGIAKGFIADAAYTYLKELGVTAAIIDAGGDIRLIGTRPGTSVWLVGVEGADGEILRVLPLFGGAAATSGAHHRAFVHNGVNYHHILNPSTGCPHISDVSLITVTAPTAMMADALSTAVFLLGADAGQELIDFLSGFEYEIDIFKVKIN